MLWIWLSKTLKSTFSGVAINIAICMYSIVEQGGEQVKGEYIQ